MIQRFTVQEIHAAINSLPDLTINGFKCKEASKKIITAPTFEDLRCAFYDPVHLDQINTAGIFLLTCDISMEGSYGVKHSMERWGRVNGGVSYVTNGCAIVAAKLDGYQIIRIANSPNCYFSKNPSNKNQARSLGRRVW